MGSGTSTSTQTTTIPQDVLNRYNSVNATAQQVAQTPFQTYSTNPNAFVAPLTGTQQAGIANTNASAGAAQPYYGAATGLTMAASPTNVGNISGRQIGQYMNPFIQSVVNPTAQLLNQQQQQAMSGQTGNAIQQGAFGGDRAGIAAANLAGQQSLAFANAINPLYSQAYNTALSTAQQQQGFDLSQQQANNQLALQQGQQLASLGTGAQAAGLQGAQAQLAAGTTEQQTQQAGLSALYNQFLQQQSYPFQTAQFLANIAEGTGALSGSTTTSTQPSSFFGNLFSDRRLKEGIRRIGETDDGQPIYKFRYKGDPNETTHIGFMADEVEKKHPEAVGEEGGFKTVNYDLATRSKHASGGVVPDRTAFAIGGGSLSDNDWQSMLMAHQNMYGPNAGGLYGGTASATPGGGKSYVPTANLPVVHLNAPTIQQHQQNPSVISDINNLATTGRNLKDAYTGAKDIKNDVSNWLTKPDAQIGAGAPVQLSSAAQGSDSSAGQSSDSSDINQLGNAFASGGLAIGGGAGGDVVNQMYGGSGLDIPDVSPTATLGSPGKNQQSQGMSGLQGLSALGSIASTGEKAAEAIPEILAMFANGGGVKERKAFATKGAVSSSDDSDPSSAPAPDDSIPDTTDHPMGVPEILSMARQIAVQKGHNPNVVSSLIGKEYGAGNQYSGDSDTSFGPLQLHYTGDPKHPAMGDNFTRDTGLDARDPSTIPAQLKYGIGQMGTQGLAPWANSRDKLGYGNWTGINHDDSTGPSPSGGGMSALSSIGSLPHALGNAQNSIGEAASNAGDWFDRNQKWLIPLLSGIGTMANSPSRYGWAAALQGLGGGAQAYANLEKQQAGIAQTQASTAQTSAQTRGINMSNYLSSWKDTPYGRVVFLANGVPILASEYQRRVQSGENVPTLGSVPPDAEARAAKYLGASQPGSTDVSPVAGGPSPKVESTPLAPPKATGAPQPPKAPTLQTPAPNQPVASAAPAKAYPGVTPGVAFDDSSRMRAESEKNVALDSGPQAAMAMERSKAYSANTTSDATTARQTNPYFNEMLSTLGDAYSHKGADTAGYGAVSRSSAINLANTISRSLGGGDIAGNLDKDDVIINKIQTLLGSQGAAAGHQESYAALSAIKAAIPNLEMNPEAGAELAAQLKTINQRALDRDDHMKAYSKFSNGFLDEAPNDFREKNGEGKYSTEQSILKDMILNRPNKLKQLMSGTIDPRYVDEAIKKWYGPGAPTGMARYFAPKAAQ
jgi:Chaperone of endosialidase